MNKEVEISISTWLRSKTVLKQKEKPKPLPKMVVGGGKAFVSTKIAQSNHLLEGGQIALVLYEKA